MTRSSTAMDRFNRAAESLREQLKRGRMLSAIQSEFCRLYETMKADPSTARMNEFTLASITRDSFGYLPGKNPAAIYNTVTGRTVMLVIDPLLPNDLILFSSIWPLWLDPDEGTAPE